MWMSVQPAAAFERHERSDIVEHTFTDFAGDDVTCQIEFNSQLVRDGSSGPFQADTFTQVLDEGPLVGDACRASVGVDVVYHDGAGRERHARAFGTQLADLQLDEVSGNYVTTHLVFFLNCSANCERTATTSPK
jgi:hypothetical protein